MKTIEAHTNERKNPQVFKRAKRIGMSLLELNVNEPVFVEIKAHGFFKSPRFPDGIEKFDVLNLKTGEEQTMWVDGGLRGQFSLMGGPEKAVGSRIEIIRGAQKQMDIVNEEGKPEKVKVNTYEIFLLD